MSFATGFFGTLARGMESKRSFIRDRIEEERTYLREQGLQRQSQVSELRNNYKSAADMVVRRLGGGEDARAMVRTALENDPEGLMQMAQYAQDPNVSSAQLRSGFNISGEFTNKSMDDILSTIIPATKDLGPDANPADVENRSFAAMLGLDTESALRQDVYGAEIVGGMTGDEILAARGTPVRATGATGSDASIYNFDVFGEQETLGTRDTALIQSQIVLSYDRMLDQEKVRLATLMEDESLSDAQKQDVVKAMREVDELKEIRDVDDVDFLRRMAEIYGPSTTLLRAQEQYGTEFMDNLMLFPDSFSTTVEQEPNNPFKLSWETPEETPEETSEETPEGTPDPVSIRGTARAIPDTEVNEEELVEFSEDENGTPLWEEVLSPEEFAEIMEVSGEAFEMAASLPSVVVETSTGKKVRVDNPSPTVTTVERGLDPSLVLDPDRIAEVAEEVERRGGSSEDIPMETPLTPRDTRPDAPALPSTGRIPTGERLDPTVTPPGEARRVYGLGSTGRVPTRETARADTALRLISDGLVTRESSAWPQLIEIIEDYGTAEHLRELEVFKKTAEELSVGGNSPLASPGN